MKIESLMYLCVAVSEPLPGMHAILGALTWNVCHSRSPYLECMVVSETLPGMCGCL